jgi:hypothetical protein
MGVVENNSTSRFFFFDMSTKEGRGKIRTSDFRFIRHGPLPIELPLGDNSTLS